jgi:hypothetical protein
VSTFYSCNAVRDAAIQYPHSPDECASLPLHELSLSLQLRLYITQPPLFFAAVAGFSGWLCNCWNAAKEIGILEVDTGPIVEDSPHVPDRVPAAVGIFIDIYESGYTW